MWGKILGALFGMALFKWPRFFLGLMIGYALLFETLGFIPASVLFGIGMARLYGGSWLHSLIYS